MIYNEFANCNRYRLQLIQVAYQLWIQGYTHLYYYTFMDNLDINRYLSISHDQQQNLQIKFITFGMIRNILQQSFRRVVTGIMKNRVPRMYFCQAKKDNQEVTTLQQALQKQHENNQLIQKKSYLFEKIKIQIKRGNPRQKIQEDLQLDGWKVSSNNNKIQLDKTAEIQQEGVTNTYNLKLITYARSARLNKKTQIFQTDEDEQIQFLTFVKKQGNDKWLVAIFLGIRQDELKLTSFYTISNPYSFIESYEEGPIEIPNYMGPNINLIKQEIYQEIVLYLQILGLGLQVFSSARELVSILQKQLALQWINEFKSFC